MPKIYPLINEIYSGSRVKYINICSNLIVAFGKDNISLGFYNTSHVDSGDEYATNMKKLDKN